MGCLRSSAVPKQKEWLDPRGNAASKSIIRKSLFQSGGQWAHPREAGLAWHYWFPQGKAKRSWNDWCNPGEGNRLWNDWCHPPVGTQSRKVWPLRMLNGAKWEIQVRSWISLELKNRTSGGSLCNCCACAGVHKGSHFTCKDNYSICKINWERTLKFLNALFIALSYYIF